MPKLQRLRQIVDVFVVLWICQQRHCGFLLSVSSGGAIRLKLFLYTLGTMGDQNSTPPPLRPLLLLGRPRERDIERKSGAISGKGEVDYRMMLKYVSLRIMTKR